MIFVSSSSVASQVRDPREAVAAELADAPRVVRAWRTSGEAAALTANARAYLDWPYPTYLLRYEDVAPAAAPETRRRAVRALARFLRAPRRRANRVSRRLATVDAAARFSLRRPARSWNDTAYYSRRGAAPVVLPRDVAGVYAGWYNGSVCWGV